jgi:hypothetical protein
MLYLGRSVTVPDRSETRSPTGSMLTIRSMASGVPTQVLACLARVLPPSSYLWTAFLIFLIFSLFRGLAQSSLFTAMATGVGWRGRALGQRYLVCLVMSVVFLAHVVFRALCNSVRSV